MADRIAEIPYISALKPQGAFYFFVDVSGLLERSWQGRKIGTAAGLADILINHFDTAVIPCGDFGFDDHIRLSYAISLEQISKGLDRIGRLIAELT